MSEEVLSPPISPSKALLQSWLNKIMKVKISDGRRLIGSFLCSDKDMNMILGSCQEFVYGEDYENEEPRILGLAMIPGKHIVSIEIDEMPGFHRNSNTTINQLTTGTEPLPAS
ncbi:N-alpha-acetyltransferase 38, NatC auxiliary subunit-like [Xenia sp. Carnegie-2017]|uniref:N-alpha-acetyltransferase 38, NatC auxiliary subunit-like n=1 Tax=Xenia sp. Carnegie-2017 TaxID=2897299 RepID=UPI001F03B03C|nr:N-alpha-acetyltransferase 38, NatC auxiliary subunit-like [Xenia sp. Carnegie-2017]